MSSNIERLKKLYALALRGVGGEKEQAAAILEKLTKKYGVSMEDLDEEIVKEYEFSFHGEREERLLRQISYKVTNDRNRFTTSYTSARADVAGRLAALSAPRHKR